MNINSSKIKVSALAKGFNDDGEGGVTCNSGILTVRPAFQREFIYSEDKQRAVIDTIIKGYPLNVFYWGEVKYGTDNVKYELIDGQQRVMSICRFVTNKFTIDYLGQPHIFTALPADIQRAINDYELTVFKCMGSESEKLDWFKTINIASEPLNEQELRNSVYTGDWLTEAKKYFSKTNCAAVKFGGNFISGVSIRQEILEKALKWVAYRDKCTIEEYMSKHRNDADARDIISYYEKVITWANNIFGEDDKDSKKVDWGILYKDLSAEHSVDANGNITCYINKERGNYSKEQLREEINELKADEDICTVSGIYHYILSGDEKKLNIRKFPDKIKLKIYKQQGGKCGICGKPFDIKDMVGDHKTPWSKGGRTDEGNCQMLCIRCNLTKSNKLEVAKNEVICKNCGKPVEKDYFCRYCGTKN